MRFFMTDKPEIIKELREDEKLGRLYGQSQGSYGKLEISEETIGSISDELTCSTNDENQESSDGLDLTEDRYNFFFNNMNDALIILNKFGKIIDINKRGIEIYGGSKNELIGKNFTKIDIFPSKDIPLLLKNFKKIFTDENVTLPICIKNKKGENIWLECSTKFTKHEKTSYILVIARDITERKKIENSLKKSEMFLQNIFDAIKDGISVLDNNLNIIKTNQWMKDMYSDNIPLVGKKCYQVYQQRDSPCPRCPSLRAIESGEIQDEILPYPSNEKPSGWLRISSFPLYNSNGRISGVIEYVKDITDYRKAEQSIKENEERLKRILENLQAGIIIIDAETHNIVDVNPMAVEMIGIPKGNIIGQTCHKFICQAEKGKCPITDLRQKVDNSERVLVNAEGKEITILKTVTPIMINDKNLLIESFVEITRQKKIERNLNEKIDELERYKQVTVGREIKMIELKNRIRELEEKLNEGE